MKGITVSELREKLLMFDGKAVVDLAITWPESTSVRTVKAVLTGVTGNPMHNAVNLMHNPTN